MKPFFFTDGSMDSALVDPSSPPPSKAILAKAQGTAPADPSGSNYDVFTANLMTQFGLTTPVSFLAQSYDATYVGAYGVVYASRSGTNYDGLDVATGIAHLEQGPVIPLGPVQWPAGVGDLLNQGSIDITGTSGPLQFDPTTGEAPGAILWWQITGTPPASAQVMVVQP